jgi:hypothetical protein
MAAKATFDADFGQFISELTKVDVKLRQFQPEADKASAKLQRMADSLNGNKLLEQAAVAVNAIRRIDGGVAALNNGELRRYGTLIDAATEKLTRMGRDVPPALAQVKAALDQARKPLDDINKSAGETTSKLGGLGSAIGTGLGIGAGLGVFDLVSQGVSGIKDAIVETVQEGNKLSQLRTAFESLSGGSAPAAAALDDLRQATRGLVSDVDLLSAANKASLLGLGDMGIKTDELASIAVRLGKAMGQDAAKSVDDLTTALARQSPQILDNLGIKVDLSAATAKYAASIGKSVDALTEEERKFAFATAAMDAARSKAETLGEAKLTLTENISKVTNSLGNMQAGLGEAINKSDLLNAAAETVIDRLDELTGNVSALGREFEDAFGPLGEYATVFLKAAGGAKILSGVLEASLMPIVHVINLALKGTIQQLDRIAALREFFAGTLTDVQLPGVGRDRTLLDPSAGQGKRAQDQLAADQKKLTAEYTKNQDEQLDRIKSNTQKGDRTLDQLAKARTERLNKLLGKDALIDAKQTIADVFGRLTSDGFQKGVGLSKLDDKTVLAIFDKLSDAKEIAKRVEPGAVKGITDALNKVAKHPAIEAATKRASQAIFEKMLGPDAIRGAKSSIAGQSGAELLDAIFGTPGDFIESRNPLNAVLSLAPQVQSSLGKVKKGTDDWRTSLQNVSQAWANLSQVMGDTFGKFNQTIGTIFAGASAAKELVNSIGDLFGKTDFAKTDGGKKLAGAFAGLAGLSTGAQLAQFGGGDALGSFLAGGVGGAATGFTTGLLAGGPVAAGIGAGVGFAAGGIGALIAQAQNARQERQLMEQNREALIAQYGTREDLIEQARRVGFSEHRLQFQILDNTDDAASYADAVSALTAAFTREQREAEKLSKSLGNVAKVNGVLSQQQLTDVRGALFRDPGEIFNPDPGGGRVRNPGTISGAPDDPGGARGGPLQEAAEGFLRQQGQSLLAGLGRILEQPGALTPSLVKAVGQSLPGALAELERQGLSSVDALRTLQPLLEKFQEKAVLAGAGSTPGFDALNDQLRLLKDERLGPLIERANGAGQSLGALQNLGLLNQEIFSGFAESITDTVAGMDLLSSDGQNAMRLIRRDLQNVWQLQQDFGYEVDESTQKLLDQAEASGLIGDKFRPVEERMVEGIETIVDRLDKLIDGFTNGFPAAAAEGAERAKRAIATTFEGYSPILRVRYAPDALPDPNDSRVTYPEDRRGEEPTLPLPPTEPVQRNPGTSSLRTIQAATAPTGRVGVYLDGRLSGEAILPHLGPILEFNGVQRVNA